MHQKQNKVVTNPFAIFWREEMATERNVNKSIA